MKKTIIIAGSILLLLFLTYRMLTEHVSNMEDERERYIGKLAFEFCGQVDSVKMLGSDRGLVWFHPTSGSFDPSREGLFNEGLKYNADLRLLIIRRRNGLPAIINRKVNLLLAGDSICINSSENRIVYYRKGKEILSLKATGALNGRPF